MNRTDRLLAIVLELQRHRRSYRRAEDLAAHFEVSKRTIYRDIQALCEAGVPIVAADRQGYALVEGYFLPPLRFTPDEALILALGSEAMRTAFDSEYRAAAQSAYRKIDAVLPTAVRDQVEQLRRGLDVALVRQLSEAQLDLLRLVRQAIAVRCRIRLHYSRRDSAADAPVQTVRDVDPYRLTRHADDWYLTGYCHLRHAVRMFRLARIDAVAVLDQAIAEDADVAAGEGASGEAIFAQVVFAHAAARWARESPPATLIDEEVAADGVRMTLLARTERELLRWLLSWGGDVRVLEPASLRAELAGHAERMLRGSGAALADD